MQHNSKTLDSKGKDKYSSRTIWIHWVSALFIFGLLITGIKMETMEVSQTKFLFYVVHFTLGTVVLILTVIRLVALVKDKKPTALYPNKSFRERMRKVVYYGFYVVLVWMCVSGLLSLNLENITPSLIEWNWEVLPNINDDGFHPIMLTHHIVAKFVLLLILMHVIGFVWHWIAKKDNTIRRIWW